MYIKHIENVFTHPKLKGVCRKVATYGRYKNTDICIDSIIEQDKTIKKMFILSGDNNNVVVKLRNKDGKFEVRG